MSHRISALVAVALTTLGLVSTGAAAREAPVHTGLFSKLAVGGYDSVAYFTEGRPVRGDAGFALEHAGVSWRFASAENRDRFAAEPERYAPRYGGYCAWAVSQGYTAAGDPQYWKIVDGRLYLNYDAAIQKRWEMDIPGHIARADHNWPAVLGR